MGRPMSIPVFDVTSTLSLLRSDVVFVSVFVLVVVLVVMLVAK